MTLPPSSPQTLASPCMWLHHMLAECPHRATRRGFLQLVVDSVQALRPYERSQYEDWVPVYAALGFAAEDGVVARTSGSFVAPADSYGDRVPLAAVPRLLDQALAFAARPPHAFLAATMRPPEPYELLTRLAGIGKEERAHLLRADAPYALMDFLTGSGGTLGSAAGGRQARAPRHMVGMPCLKEAARAAALLVRCCDWGVDEDERPSPLAVDGGQHPPSARVQDLMVRGRSWRCPSHPPHATPRSCWSASPSVFAPTWAAPVSTSSATCAGEAWATRTSSWSPCRGGSTLGRAGRAWRAAAAPGATPTLTAAARCEQDAARSATPPHRPARDRAAG